MSNQTDDAPEGFKMTELGSIPDDWRVVKLGDIADSVIGGGTPSTARSDYWDGPIQWTTSRRISGTHLGSGERGITQKGLEESSTHLIPRGNLLVGTRVGVGKVAVNDVDMAISQDLTGVFVNRGKYSVDFLVFQMLSARIQEEFYHCARGTTIKGIPRDDLVKIPLAIPPLSEQEAIAEVLSTVEQAIEAQDKVMAAASELKKSLMKHLFTYGPVPLAEAEKVPLKETEIGPMPEHWGIRMVSEVCEVTGSTVSLPQLIEKDTRDANHCMVHGIKVADMNLPGNERQFANANIRARLPESLAKRLSVPPDSIVFPKRGAAIATNKKRLTTAWTALDPNLIAVSPLGEVDCHYVFYWFLTIDIAEFQSPGPTPQLNKKDIAPALMPIPPQREQQEVALILSSVDNKIEAETMRKIALQTLFKTMLHNLMTGKVRLKDMEGMKA